MESKSLAREALKEFILDFRVMDELVMDGAAKQVGKRTRMMKTIKKHEIKHRITEPRRHNQNQTEGIIREFKRKWFCILVKKKVPKRLRDYRIRWVCEVMRITANTARTLHGCTPLEEIMGETPDISEYLDFSFMIMSGLLRTPELETNPLGDGLGFPTG